MSYYYPPNNPRNNDRNSHRTVDAVFNPRTSKMGTYYSDSNSKSVSSAASFQHYLKGRIVSPETPPERTHHYNYNHQQQQQQQHSPQWLNIEVPAFTLAEKRVVLAQYSHNHGGGYSHSKVLDEYCKFMAIKIMNDEQQKKQRPNNNILCPPKCIDKMWLSHIVCTEEYFAFCER